MGISKWVTELEIGLLAKLDLRIPNYSTEIANQVTEIINRVNGNIRCAYLKLRYRLKIEAGMANRITNKINFAYFKYVFWQNWMRA